ncbi:MAG: NAD(P)/FAD-dependent oxidoreductase [Thermoplasmata archaeon]|uniref:Digeranylgeranylglycerophospholipid reductase n=1 Tax=Candidatus Sysuiplasma superficiale TaxID=2823368 RepID=A0A8J7YJY6_9ARCH|nr:NAD(P)/FAD-dependent oxidoreductase [Candidatus Sysuiplasma superficiale]MBX8644196.1 NAD(P)/FAD-dependent oxidoreductase [Candidatus Sysuiplasma superficiale]
MELEYDVVVVGAGPGGSVAAKYAAMAGCSTLMIEKRQEIGTPVRCGEGIAKRWLDDVGIEPSKKWIANEVDGARIISPNGTILTVDESRAGNECGFVIHRDVFDMTLAQQAASAGAEVMVKTSATGIMREDGRITGVRARSMGREFNIKSKIVIAADGFESQVGRWAGINTNLKPKDVDSCYEYTLVGVDIDRRYTDFFIGNIAPGGYIWMFPKGNDIANVGIGVQTSKIKGPGEAKMYLDRFIQKHPEFSKGKPIMEIAGGVSISPPLERTTLPGLMLVGDAARMIDPVTGGGIYNACIAGRIAGEVAGRAVENADYSQKMMDAYEKGWRDRMEEHLYRNYLMKEKISRLDDATFDRLVEAMTKVDMKRMTTLDILRAIQQKYPDLVKEFEEFM